MPRTPLVSFSGFTDNPSFYLILTPEIPKYILKGEVLYLFIDYKSIKTAHISKNKKQKVELRKSK